MRRLFIVFFVLLGVGAGALSASHDDWGLKVVMMVIGAAFGGAIGGGLANLGRGRRFRRLRTEDEVEPIPGMGLSGRDLAANYWRDSGHPPFMKPPRPELGNRMLDADKTI